jgi:hypothetical protein
MKRAALLGFVCAVACGPNAEQRKALDDIQAIEVGKASVRANLKGPETAQFRNVVRRKAVCGEVNAKNGFGGYGGYQRFMAGGGGTAFLEREVPKAQFEAAWAEMC